MPTNPADGRLADPSQLVDLNRLYAAYEETKPDPSLVTQRVAFGTSGHRGSAFHATFNQAHILAIAEAVCRYRQQAGIDGPLFLGRDTHALSEPAFRSVLEVLAAHGVEVRIDAADGFTPTPVISHAILTWNRDHQGGAQADGIVITPSHNPPQDGGIKYNPPNGGPADTDVTDWIQGEANRLLAEELDGVQRTPYDRAITSGTVRRHDYLSAYVPDLASIIDFDAIRSSGISIGVDPLGGSSVAYWPAIAERYRLNLTVINDKFDPTFRFVPVDWDGAIRTDCSSPWAMASIVARRNEFDLAVGNDADSDRHGIVTRSAGLLNPNHYLCAAISYLFRNRPSWPQAAAIGKTLVSSSLIDRVAADIGRSVLEVPVGFKWFVPGLIDGTLGFGGEESGGGAFLRMDGRPWTTDKDGMQLCLLAAELTGRLGKDPSEVYRDLTNRLGNPVFRRVDAPASPVQKDILKGLSPSDVAGSELAGEAIQQVLTAAPGNGSPIGGLKVVAPNGFFAARPSGTEATYRIYAESFKGEDHLTRILEEAQVLVDRAIAAKAR
jgi:phosphoglucomutase